MHAQYPLRWLNASYSAGERLPHVLDEGMYSAVHELSQLAQTIRRVPTQGEEIAFEAYDHWTKPVEPRL